MGIRFAMRQLSMWPQRSVSAILEDDRTRFILAGIWNTGFGLLVFGILANTGIGILSPFEMVVLTYAIALPPAFLVHKWFVFKSSGDVALQFRRFAITNTTLFMGNLVTVPIVASSLEWPLLAAQCVYVAASTVLSYGAHRNWAFK